MEGPFSLTRDLLYSLVLVVFVFDCVVEPMNLSLPLTIALSLLAGLI